MVRRWVQDGRSPGSRGKLFQIRKVRGGSTPVRQLNTGFGLWLSLEMRFCFLVLINCRRVRAKLGAVVWSGTLWRPYRGGRRSNGLCLGETGGYPSQFSTSLRSVPRKL